MIFSKIAYKTLRPRPLFSQNKHAHHYVNNHIWSDLNHKTDWGFGPHPKTNRKNGQPFKSSHRRRHVHLIPSESVLNQAPTCLRSRISNRHLACKTDRFMSTSEIHSGSDLSKPDFSPQKRHCHFRAKTARNYWTKAFGSNGANRPAGKPSAKKPLDFHNMIGRWVLIKTLDLILIMRAELTH